MMQPTFAKQARELERFNAATMSGAVKPETISYMKDAESGFYRILAYNQPADVEPGKVAA
jgi:hypothetical protein